MSAQPYMPLFVDAFIADTTHLSSEELGAYMLLLMAMWRRNGSVPDDDRDLARITRTGRKWKRIKERLRPMLTFIEGEVTQKRLQKEMDYVKQFSTKQRENAKARWNKNKPLADAKAMPKPCPHTQTHIDTNVSIERAKSLPPDWEPSSENQKKPFQISDARFAGGVGEVPRPLHCKRKADEELGCGVSELDAPTRGVSAWTAAQGFPRQRRRTV